MALDPLTSSEPTLEGAVHARYTAAAVRTEAALCCPVSYEPRYLEAIPAEVLERDYGCGDPSRYVREGDVVLDLGSGGGKICFIAAQIAGPKGLVIGVDVNEEMLALARRAAPLVAERIGFANVEFRRGFKAGGLVLLDEFLELQIVVWRSPGDNLIQFFRLLIGERRILHFRKCRPIAQRRVLTEFYLLLCGR